MEFPLRGGDGRFRLFLTRIHPLKDAEGRVVRWFGTNTDVEKLKQAEAALRESEQRLKLAHQAAHIGAFEWNVQTGVNIWTPELEAMYGLKPGEFGRTQPAWEQLVHPEDRAGAVRTVERAFQTFQPEEGEWRVVWPDGSVHWVIGRFQVFKDHAGKPLRLTGVNLDITERKLLEREILSAVDQERQRLGRDLHDGLCQILTATKFKLGLLQRKLARKSPVEPAEALMLEQEVNRAIEQAQAMAQGLNPVRLVAQGLTCALGELARSIQVSFQVRCTCDSGERVTIADQATAQHLYRIAQEAVRNALNHGKARNIRIELKELGERISLAVRDDGVGFSPASEQGAGMGLHNMKARAQMIRGSLDIESGQPGGTVVTCTLPRVRDESASS
jgi:PAS domain S-box-containing protein